MVFLNSRFRLPINCQRKLRLEPCSKVKEIISTSSLGSSFSPTQRHAGSVIRRGFPRFRRQVHRRETKSSQAHNNCQIYAHGIRTTVQLSGHFPAGCSWLCRPSTVPLLIEDCACSAPDLTAMTSRRIDELYHCPRCWDLRI